MNNRRVYTIRQLNHYIKSVLEEDMLLSQIFIEGEISNFKAHTSGHMYFTLKDEYAAVNCVMFKTYAVETAFIPENGMKIVALGKVSLYEKTGQYQFYAEDIEPWGKGGLYLAFEQMKAKLAGEGIFDPAHKKPIPEYPAEIAVITSPTGAAVRDIISVATRRNRGVKLTVIPVQVQGQAAAGEIAEAIAAANEWRGADVIILARGGGSIEDLWPFNEEALARAIYRSKIPVVSAVGHETDYCISDFAADMRAPTPSAAAELCVPELSAIVYTMSLMRQRMSRGIQAKLENNKTTLNAMSARLAPGAFLEAVYSRQIYLEQLLRKLTRDMAHKTEITRMRLAKSLNSLELASPAAVLKRGYAMVYGDGGVKTSAAMISPGEALTLRLHDGAVAVKAEGEYNG